MFFAVLAAMFIVVVIAIYRGGLGSRDVEIGVQASRFRVYKRLRGPST